MRRRRKHWSLRDDFLAAARDLLDPPDQTPRLPEGLRRARYKQAKRGRRPEPCALCARNRSRGRYCHKYADLCRLCFLSQQPQTINCRRLRMLSAEERAQYTRGQTQARKHRRRESLYRSCSSGVTPADWRAICAVFVRDGVVWCAYCAESEARTVEHVVPLCRGGRHDVDNVLPVCSWCNTSKGAKLLTAWRGAQRIWGPWLRVLVEHTLQQITPRLYSAGDFEGHGAARYLTSPNFFQPTLTPSPADPRSSDTPLSDTP